MTVVHCGTCGRRTAEAYRGDDPRYDEEVRTVYDVVFIEGRYDAWNDVRRRMGLPQQRAQWRPEVITAAESDLDWPLVWMCQHCGVNLTLAEEQGRRVGQVDRLIAANVDDFLQSKTRAGGPKHRT